jgi:FkbM family methyltransferase
MRLDELERLNRAAMIEAKRFMRSVPQNKIGVIDQNFHYQKNHFPYFGFVDVVVGDTDFVMFSANDDLVAMTFFWYGPDAYEPASMRLWRERAASARTILDIGAFSGVYALVAAGTNPDCTVHAMEAARRTYGRLLANTQINRLTHRVHCANLAVSSGRGHETFMRFRGENILGIGDSFLAKENVSAQASEERVETIGLDAFCKERDIEPDLVKIDVEGAELLALDGMPELLAARRDHLLIEVTPKTGPEVALRLSGAGYAVYRIDERSGDVTRCEDGKVPGVVNLLAERSKSLPRSYSLSS